jgi:Bacterial alpha-L-rhamnosidase 6 hairpin glycosidase domain
MSIRRLTAVLPALLVWLVPGATADIALDPVAKTATVSSADETLSLHLRFDDRCLVDQLSIFGRQVVAPQTGACTAVKVNDAWHTTRAGIASPQVKHDGPTLRLTDIHFGPPDFPVTEEWLFAVADDHIDWTITRTYHASGQLQDTYFPGFDFLDMATWTGGILDTGGVAWTKYLDTPQATYSSHSGSVIFWNKDTEDCLKVAASPAPPAQDLTARFSRHPSNIFSASFWPSDTPLVPGHGLARFLADRQDVWRPAPISVDRAHPLTITNTVTLTARRYDEVSNLGTLVGIDGDAVRELLNTIGRYGVIDRGLSGSNGWRSSYICTHEPWLAQFGLALADPNFIANFTLALDEIKRSAITPEGRVLARWHAHAGDAMPGTFNPETGYYEAQWGYLLDSQPSYVICVAEQFDLTGDLAWLRSHRESCRAALDYMLRRDNDHDGLLEVIPQSCKEERGSDWIDIVWASHENALVNAEMFEALTQWSALEDLMGHTVQGRRYRQAARKLKAAFNKPIADGGFWNPGRGWYVYWREPDHSIHGDNLVTPVNFAAIAYGLCDDPERRAVLLTQIETLMQKEDLFHWPLCFFPFQPEEVHARQKVFPAYENGDLFLGWAELAVRSYASVDPALALKYIRKVIERYNIDGLSFQRCLRADGAGVGDDILANNAMAIVGLYRDIYGVRPRHDRLFLDPNLTSELSGTQLLYPLRSAQYTIDLATERSTISANSASVTAAHPFGVDIEGGRVRYFSTIGQPAELSLTARGHVPFDVVVDAWSPKDAPTQRRWTVRAGSGAPVSIDHVVAGLASGADYELHRNGEPTASLRANAEGVVKFSIGNIAMNTQLSLETTSVKQAPRIVNIVNFIRGVEPRVQVDLVEPIRQQLRLGQEYKLPTTFLLQYDALVDPAFTDLLKSELGPEDEIGAWLEVVQPQVEAAGLTWRGRFPWDWHTDVGFTIGYTPAERRKLMDVYMEQFKATFGRLPRSVGCWVIDAPTLNYLADEYGIVAACICKDQVGTDGYNLWGGYWNQAYYPSRLNAYMPAQSDAEQLNVPVFRMLGSDPIHQYDTGLGSARQGVISLEPVYRESGGDPAWVRWFFQTNFDAPCLSFAYAQAGQENSFGWPAMSKGLAYQYQLLAAQSRAGHLRVETLGASGDWFRETFDKTPATSVVALTDWRDEGKRSVWYESRFYRINLFWEGTDWRVRDLHLFDEAYAERYLTERVTTNHCTYDTLPVLDGFHWSAREGEPAGMRLVALAPDGARRPLEFGAPTVTELGAEVLLVTMPLTTGGEVTIRMEPTAVRLEMAGAGVPTDWALELAWSAGKPTSIIDLTEHAIRYRHNGYDYSLRCGDAVVSKGADARSLRIRPQGRALTLTF